MSASLVREEVERFFARWGGASLKLPNGWFGRAHDNFHELTSICVADEVLTIELDDALRLVIDQPMNATVTGPSLRISGFEKADWKWTEYGSDVEHHERFLGGVVKFVARE